MGNWVNGEIRLENLLASLVTAVTVMSKCIVSVVNTMSITEKYVWHIMNAVND
jgi:hypothetical protein